MSIPFRSRPAFAGPARLAAAVVPVLLAAGPAVAGAPAFTSEASIRGISYVPDQTIQFGDGVTFADLDDDGDPDVIIVGRSSGAIGLYENDGTGHFVDRFATSGIGNRPLSSGTTAADYDRDGDLDIYLARREQSNVLLRNDGNFQFTNVTAAAGVGDTGDTGGCSWGDYDNDGWLDLYVANRYQLNRLYRNQGDGTFTDVAVALGVDRTDDPTFQAAFFDFDHDGDADIYLATDHGRNCQVTGHRNHLFENLGGTFVDITESSGTEACLDAMCVAVGDFDGNGLPDLYSTNTPSGNALLLNQGNGTFTDQTAQAGVGSFAVGWGSVFLDYDLDGRLDLYVCNSSAPNRLYTHGGSFPCADVAPAENVDVGFLSFAVAAADIENDGDLDLLVMSRGEPIRLLVNHADPARHWVKLDVIGEGPNRFAVGAVADVTADGRSYTRQVIAGENYKAQNELILHVGLDDAATVDAVEVMWPGGATRTISNLAADTTWRVYPTDKLGDADGDGDRDFEDLVHLDACFGGTLTPGCEMMDYDGDGGVDLDDVDAFLLSYDGVIDDCNGNGIADLREIIAGTAADADGNWIVDACETVIGDANGDGLVGFPDLLAVISAWSTDDAAADLNDDGFVGLQDLLLVLSYWD